MTKKGRKKFWAVKWDLFPKRSLQNFSVPPNSAPSLRQCNNMIELTS